MADEENKINFNPDDIVKQVITQHSLQDHTLESNLVITGIISPDKGKEIVSSLYLLRDRSLELHKENLKGQQQKFRETITKYESDLSLVKSSRIELENKLKDNDNVYQSSDQIVREYDGKRRSLILKLMKRRETYPEKVLNDNITKKKILRNQILSEFKEEWGAVSVIQKQVYDDAMKIRELNSEEYKRRIDFLNARLEKTSKSFEKIIDLLTHLSKTGINRTTVGFLTWAGYACLPALGWLIGELLVNTYQGNLGSFQKIFEILVLAESTFFDKVGFGLGFVVLIFLPLIIMAILLMVFASIKFVVSQVSSTKEQDKKKKQNKQKNYLGSIVEHFPFNQFTYFQGGWKNPNDQVKNIFTVYLWLIIPLLLGALFYLGIKNENYNQLFSQIQDQTASTIFFIPWSSLFYTYLGIVICLIFAGFTTVYVVRVVQPRLLAIEKDTVFTSWSWLKMNIELVIIALLIVFVTVFFDAIRLVDPTLPKLWSMDNFTIIFILVLANAISLAYGISLRGLFRDAESYKHEIQLYEDEIQTYSELPSFDLPEEFRNQFLERLKTIEQQVNNIWNNADFYSIPMTSYPVVSYLVDNNNEIMRSENTLKHTNDPLLGFTKYDALYESDISAELTGVIDMIIKNENTKSSILNKNEELKKQIDKIDEKETLIKKILDELTLKLIAVENELITTMNKTELEFMSTIAKASNAIRLGELILGKKGS